MADSDLVRAAKIVGASFIFGFSCLSLVLAVFRTGPGSTWLSGIGVFPLLLLVSASLLCHAWTGQGLMSTALHRLKTLGKPSAPPPDKSE